MKFTIKKASDWNYRGAAEIDTLEDLLFFAKLAGHSLVLNTTEPVYEQIPEAELEAERKRLGLLHARVRIKETIDIREITIYDDYME